MPQKRGTYAHPKPNNKTTIVNAEENQTINMKPDGIEPELQMANPSLQQPFRNEIEFPPLPLFQIVREKSQKKLSQTVTICPEDFPLTTRNPFEVLNKSGKKK